MKKFSAYFVVLVIVIAVGVALRGDAQQSEHALTKSIPVKRVGMVIGIKAEQITDYKNLHAADHPGVRDLLNKYHMHNFSIFLQKMPDGKWYEFGYYEYTGDDFKSDMSRLAEEPRNIEWGNICSPMQIPLPGATGWTEMEAVYFNE